MKKVFDQLERQGLMAGPWDYEIDALRVEQGMKLYKAKCHVIMQWMMDGDLRPLLASIKENGVLRGPPLTLLVRMIENGELAFKGRGRGRHPDREAAVRNELIADMYEEFSKEGVGSDPLVQAIGSVGAVSEKTVWQAVRDKRNTSKTRPKPK
jgi:hypothetical protein